MEQISNISTLAGTSKKNVIICMCNRLNTTLFNAIVSVLLAIVTPFFYTDACIIESSALTLRCRSVTHVYRIHVCSNDVNPLPHGTLCNFNPCGTLCSFNPVGDAFRVCLTPLQVVKVCPSKTKANATAKIVYFGDNVQYRP